MNSSSVIKNISIIVAYRNSGRHLLDMFIDLKLWFSEITIVGPNCSKNSQKTQHWWNISEKIQIDDIPGIERPLGVDAPIYDEAAKTNS